MKIYICHNADLSVRSFCKEIRKVWILGSVTHLANNIARGTPTQKATDLAGDDSFQSAGGFGPDKRWERRMSNINVENVSSHSCEMKDDTYSCCYPLCFESVLQLLLIHSEFKTALNAFLMLRQPHGLVRFGSHASSWGSLKRSEAVAVLISSNWFFFIFKDALTGSRVVEGGRGANDLVEVVRCRTRRGDGRTQDFASLEWSITQATARERARFAGVKDNVRK